MFPVGETLVLAEVDEDLKIVVTAMVPNLEVRRLDARWHTVAALSDDRLVLIHAELSVPPEIVGEVQFENSPVNLDIDGDLVYVSTFQGLHIIRIGNPAEPEEIWFFETTGNLWDFAVSGGMAYLLGFDGTLTVVDAADPGALSVVGELVPGWEGGFSDVIVGDDLLYLTAATGPGLSIVDAGDPTEPVIIGTYQERIGDPRAMEYEDGLLFLATAFDGIHIVDVGVPETPQRVDVLPVVFDLEAIALLEDWVVAATIDGIHSRTWNSDPDVKTLGSYLAGGRAQSVTFANGVAVVGGSGLRILESVDGRGHRELAFYGDSGAWTDDLEVVDETAYWVRGHSVQDSPSVQLIDLRRPQYPYFRGRINGSYQQVSVGHGMIHLLAADKIAIFREHTTGDPEFVSEQALPGQGTAFVVSGGLAVVAVEERGLAVIDIQAPSEPALIGQLQLSGSGSGIAIDRDIAYVAGFEDALIAVDLSRPNTPRELGRVEISSPPADLELQGRCLYLATDDQVLQFDVSDPADMTVAVSMDVGDNIQDIGIGETVLAAARLFDGVSVQETGACVCRFEPPRLFIPAAGSGNGAKNSEWSTDVVVNNPGETPMRYEFRFLERGEDNASAEAVGPFALDAGLSVRYDDILSDLFGVAQGGGAIRFDTLTDSTPVLSSRTKSTDSDGATFGQGIPAADSRDLFRAGQRVRLLQINESQQYRTNIGFMSGSEIPLTLTVEFWSSAGEFLGSEAIDLQPYGVEQWNQPLRNFQLDDVVNGYADVWADTDGAAFTTYASMVDNTTNDPTFIAPVEIR